MTYAYEAEIAELEASYSWARSFDITRLASAVSRSLDLPLVAVGSGGALTSAALVATLHRWFAEALALITTPLLLTGSLPKDRRAAVVLISAGGGNEDIRAALRAAAERAPRRMIVLCGQPESPLVEDANSIEIADIIAVPLPGRDRFLATHSLVAFSVLLTRAYASAFHRPAFLPTSLKELIDASLAAPGGLSALARRCEPLWRCENLLILHDASTFPGAVDLESRLAESAIMPAQVADFRGFAHGRQLWLARPDKKPGVLALASPDTRNLAASTLELLPNSAPAVTIEWNGNTPDVALASALTSIHLAAFAGRARGVDLGKPPIHDFVMQLYKMKMPAR
ncbi:MAG: hypothetical protein HUU21_28115 [Polyangiaceae bacterium]|nr:hypothetical protein [Polyangiaceae bacterium]